MTITGLERADLAVLFGNSDFRIYQITRNKELEEMILQSADAFWSNYVLTDILPPMSSEQDCRTLLNQGKARKTLEANHEAY